MKSYVAMVQILIHAEDDVSAIHEYENGEWDIISHTLFETNENGYLIREVEEND